MDNLIIRIDDVSPNTDLADLRYQIKVWRDFGAKFIVGVSLFAEDTKSGSVYPNPPFKNRSFQELLSVNKTFEDLHFLFVQAGIKPDEIASHGLLHIDHSEVSRDAQMMSILASCSILRTKKFIPPFNKFNHETEEICEENNIEIIRNTKSITWRSLDWEPFDARHNTWYYHPWRIHYLDVVGATMKYERNKSVV